MTWNVLQSAGNNASPSTASVTYGSDLTAGSVLIAVVNAYQGTTSAVSDGNGNNFTEVASADLNNSQATNGELSLWVLATPAGDAGTAPVITPTRSNSSYWAMVILEVTGIQAVADGTAGTAFGFDNTISPSYSSAAASEFLLSVYADTQHTSSTPAFNGGAGWTLDSANQFSNGNVSAGCAYANSTGGAESDGWTNSDSSATASILVALTPGGGTVSAAAALTGTGTLTAGGHKTVPGAVALSGAGTLTAGGQKHVPGAAALGGSGTLTAGAHKTVPAAVAMSGSGTLTATPRPRSSGGLLIASGIL